MSIFDVDGQSYSWFHPPDGFVAGPTSIEECWRGISWDRGSFERPYRDQEVWEEIAIAVQSKMDELHKRGVCRAIQS
jgi:hypothetical protein